MQTGAPLEHFAHKSSGEMLMAIVGGKVLMALADAPPVFGHLRAGNVGVLAVEMMDSLRLSDGREHLGDYRWIREGGRGAHSLDFDGAHTPGGDRQGSQHQVRLTWPSEASRQWGP
jgi:hypothetical protein